MELEQITKIIIGCAYKVANKLGSGFLEKVYENALAHEIKKAGLNVKQQNPISVIYDDIIVGEYMADLIIEDKIIIELKAIKDIEDVHKAQCINYIKATGLPICLLINFGKQKVQIKRFKL